MHFLLFHSLDDPLRWMTGTVASFMPPLHIPGNNIVWVLSLLWKHAHYSTLHALWKMDYRTIMTQL